ncbi:MAG: phosphodiester glycosidase family protein [Clostridia bacterium]|nr:phosphodiester glycosidase family protein [Clostridia bacterium]
MRKYAWAITFGIALSLLMTYALLDTFVFPREIDPIMSNPAFDDGGSVEAGAVDHGIVQTDDCYNDGSIEVNINTERYFDTDVYIADIVIADPSYLKTGLAEDKCGVHYTETVSSMSERLGAIVSINGDYYGFRAEGFVMRNGVLYRTSSSGYEALVINLDGSFSFADENVCDATTLVSGARDILSFGPTLVKNGEPTVDENTVIVREYLEQVSNPRTAIGFVGTGHYVFVVSDGRTEESAGLSVYQLALKMKQLGCTDAYNLDGGGSAEMWFCGRVVNKPTWDGSKIEEREVSDIVYIGR